MPEDRPATLAAPSDALIERLRARLGPAGLREGAEAEPYLRDPRGLTRGSAALVLRPASTEEVAEIVGLCAEARVAITPWGGGTGLVGGQLRPEGPPGLLLSLERMNRVRETAPDDNVMIAEAGVILADAQAAAAAAGRLFPLSIAAEGTARIGGVLSTNAGGVNVLRYGMARDLCLGVEAVLPDGSVHHGLRRLRKDNTGYDLRNLLVGAEGTLGVITAASLRLFPRPAQTATAFAAVASPDAALALLHHLQARLGEQVSAFELIHATGAGFALDHVAGVRHPLARSRNDLPEWSCLIEAGAGTGDDLSARLEGALAEALEGEMISDAALAQSEGQRADFWRLRESIPEANRKVGSVASHDISVPVSRIAAFVEAARAALLARVPGLRINAFGHLGDGNLHYNLFAPEGAAREDFMPLKPELTRIVHDLVAAHDGSISAEHGIGRYKTEDLARYGDPAKLAAMRAIKRALDPAGIMNPGAVLG